MITLFHTRAGSRFRKFVLYSSLLAFTLLLAVRLDGLFSVSFYFVFVPLFFAQLLVFLGFLSGLAGFILAPPSRLDPTSKHDFCAMLFSTFEHILLLCFELLICFKLETPNAEIDGVPLSWVLVFSPLFLQSFVAMVISIWCIRHDKMFQFEMSFAVNVIQFVFIAFKLDGAMHWNWPVVFVPVWAMFSLFYIGVIYSLIITIFLSRSLHVLSAHRRSHLFSTCCSFFVSIPLLMFFVLLSNKLDSVFQSQFPPHHLLQQHQSHQLSAATASGGISSRGRVQLPYTVVASPLLVALLFLVTLSFGDKSGNTWWFAMRKPFCVFIFDKFPCLQQYANISYKFGEDQPRQRVAQTQPAPSVERAGGSGERLRMLHSVEVQLASNTIGTERPRTSQRVSQVKCKLVRGLGQASSARVASTSSTGQISPVDLMKPD